jgi:hypothetical protein
VADFIHSGRVADLVLLCLVIEAALLGAWRWRTGGGLAWGTIATLVVPGMMLALALRSALTEAWWGWVAMWLGAALVAHLADLHRRIGAANRTEPLVSPGRPEC